MLLQSRTPLIPATTSMLVVGNSHPAGEGSSNTVTHGWPGVMMSQLPAGLTMVNEAIAGQRIQSMIDNISTQVYANLVANKLNIIFAQEFGNELSNNGRNVQAAYAKWVSYCNSIRTYAAANNRKVYIISVGMHPTAGVEGTPPADSLARIESVLAVNVLLRENYPQFCDQFADLGRFSPFKELFEGGDYSMEAFIATGMYNRANGVVDRVHFGDAGHARVGGIMADAARHVRAR